MTTTKRKYGKILPERKKLGMTQAKFAKALDVRQATVSSWELNYTEFPLMAKLACKHLLAKKHA